MRAKRHPKLCPIASRRQFLSTMGVGALYFSQFDPIRAVIRSMVEGLITEAQAAETGTKPKNYIAILMRGAPQRWVFDGFLSPRGPLDPFRKNPNCVTALTENHYSADSTQAAYKVDEFTFDGRKIYLPPLWSARIPESGGGWVPMSDLLANTLIMRGVDMGADFGHTYGPARVLLPLGGSGSINGLVADASGKTIPAVGLSQDSINYGDPRFGGYRAPNESAIALFSGSGMSLEAVLSPFIDADSAVLAGKGKLGRMEPYIAAAMDELGAYAKSSYPGADILYANYGNAQKMFAKAFGDLGGQFTALYQKYDNLAARCRDPIPYLIPPTGVGGYDLSDFLYSRDWTAQFAVAEYLIKAGYCSSFVMGGSGSRIANLSTPEDEHDEPDRQRAVIANAFRYRALAASIHELKKSLGPLWSETVVHLSCEFGRCGGATARGSDHAPNANVVTLMSGAITKPLLIGNITQEYGDTKTYPGTWGAGTTTLVEGKPISLTNEVAASTVAALVGVRSPVRAKPVISVGAKVECLAEEAKNV